jgi:glycine hydroxymethyltransferase
LILCRKRYAKDINRSVFPGLQGGPLMHVIAGKAVCFGEAMRPEFRTYCQAIIDNARTLADELSSGGLTLITGGTDNHLMLVDVTPLGITGQIAEETLGRCGITVNKNMIPFDQRRPLDPSGIRIGTPALTTRGMGTAQMRTIGRWMLDALQHPDDQDQQQRIRGQVSELCQDFPAPA